MLRLSHLLRLRIARIKGFGFGLRCELKLRQRLGFRLWVWVWLRQGFVLDLDHMDRLGLGRRLVQFLIERIDRRRLGRAAL